MQMSAITANYSFEDAIIKAINAGNDILLYSNNNPSGYDKNLAYKVRDAIFTAVRSGKISPERILESYDRTMKLKKKFKII